MDFKDLTDVLGLQVQLALNELRATAIKSLKPVAEDVLDRLSDPDAELTAKDAIVLQIVLGK